MTQANNDRIEDGFEVEELEVKDVADDTTQAAADQDVAAVVGDDNFATDNRLSPQDDQSVKPSAIPRPSEDGDADADADEQESGNHDRE